MIELIEASDTQDFAQARLLFEEYISGLGVDLTFQNVTHELDSIDRVYVPPSGALILAKEDSAYVGCIALRKLDAYTCEMKRLYVKPEGRGKRLGLTLAEKIIEQAKILGYEKLRLDTLPDMISARGLYKKMGFYEIDPYYDSPIAGTSFMELSLI